MAATPNWFKWATAAEGERSLPLLVMCFLKCSLIATDYKLHKHNSGPHPHTGSVLGCVCAAMAAGRMCDDTEEGGRCWQITPTKFSNGVIYLNCDHHRTKGRRKKRERRRRSALQRFIRWDAKSTGSRMHERTWPRWVAVLKGGGTCSNLHRRPAFRRPWKKQIYGL